MLDILRDYATKKAELLKMEATEKTVLITGTAFYIALAMVATFFFIILLNIGVGLLIGFYLDNYAYGVLIVAGFYLLFALIVILFRKTIRNWIANKMIKTLNS